MIDHFQHNAVNSPIVWVIGSGLLPYHRTQCHKTTKLMVKVEVNCGLLPKVTPSSSPHTVKATFQTGCKQGGQHGLIVVN